MGKHRNGAVAPQARGRHRAPTTTGRNVARVAVAGAVLGPAMVGAGVEAPAAAAAPREAPRALPALSVTGVLDDIARCESGGRYDAQNGSSSASGKYQMLDSTWRSFRGDSSAARAKDAPPAAQEAAARRLLAAQGTTPWNASRSCWGGAHASAEVDVGEAPRKTARRQPPAAKQEPPARRPQPRHLSDRPHVSVKEEATITYQPKHRSTGRHRVRPGDTLSGIALQYQGDASWWRLYESNREVVGANPNLIYPGQSLVVH